MIFIPFTTLFSFIPKSTPFPLEQTEREREKERDCPLKHTTVTDSLDGDSKGVFQGQHLPSLSINYVANLEKQPTTTAIDKLKNCYDQDYNDVGFVI